MPITIPDVVNELYGYFVMPPDPEDWPEYISHDPVAAHGLVAFYRGLVLGLRLGQLPQIEQL